MGDRNLLPKKRYERELLRLQAELVKLQEWVRAEQTRVVAEDRRMNRRVRGAQIALIFGAGSPSKWTVCRLHSA